MEDKKILLDNIDKIHTTEMGIDRIKRNLKIDTADVVEYCKNKVLDKNCNIAYSARTAHPFQRNGAPFRFKLSKAQQVD